MPLPSLGFLRLTPPKPEDVGAPSSGTDDLIERVRDYYVNRERERRVFLGAETGNVQLIHDNVGLNNIYRRNDLGYTPLHVAVDAAHINAVVALLEASTDGVDDLTGFADSTRLRMPSIYMAAMRNHVEILRALLDANADINRQTSEGQTAMMVASRHGHEECFTELGERGSELNLVVDNRGNAVIHHAVSRNRIDMIVPLINYGANLDLAGEDGFTPLQIAIHHDHNIIARMLIAAGVNLDTQNDRGSTALHIACAEGNVDVVENLLEYNANRDLLDNNGFSARRLAEVNSYRDIVRMFET